MFFGWGDAKNNLTAASLRIRQPFIFQNWEEPTYTNASNAPNRHAPAPWHYIDDPTSNQPSTVVYFTDFAESSNFGAPNITSSTIGLTGVEAKEIYSGDYTTYPAYEYFPEKVKISINLDFTMPSNLGYNQAYEIPVNVYHNTENQGDLNWS